MLPDFRVRQRDFLLEISRAITAQLELSEVLRRVLKASVAMMAGQCGLVALRAEDEHFYVRAFMGIESAQIPEINFQLRDLVSSMGKEAKVDALNERFREMAASIDSNLRQSIALPLSFAGEPLGLLIVFRSYRTTVTTNDLQILQSFIDQAAIAVHNAQLYERIDRERNQLAAILDHSADGIMILAPDLQILHFNHALARLTQWTVDEAISHYHDEVIQWERLEHDDLQAAIERGWPFNGEDTLRNTLYVEGDLRSRNGINVSVGITYAAMLTSDNRIANVIANVRDITNFRQAQEMQNVFISGISHELKTPVAIIKGYAATLRREDAVWDPKVIQDNLAVIEEEADRLTALIQDLLTASRIQAQRELKLDLSEVWLDLLTEQVVERFRTQTDKHQFLVEFPPDFPVIQGDEVRLRQVFDNLIGNAIKYSPHGGLIRIWGKWDQARVTIAIEDQGVGIAERDQDKIFDRFYRVDSKLSRRTQGTGLGLYLAKAIITAHRGAIGVHSDLGKGSVFYFTLPYQPASI